MTFAKCAEFPVLRICDAHISGGEWKHLQGVKPCTPGVIDAEEIQKVMGS
jgi:hypothetical protein